MSMNDVSHTSSDIAVWKPIVAKFQQSSLWRAVWQMTNTLGAYAVTWLAIYFALGISWWLVPPLALLAAGFVVRIFIIFHDCGHKINSM